MTPDTLTTADGRTVPLDGLEAAARAATPGPWMWFNGCSWWRLGTAYVHKGELIPGKHDAVLCPTKDRHDGHPDLVVSQENRKYLEQADPLVCLALVAEVRRLRECNERQRQSLALYQGPHVTMTVEHADALWARPASRRSTECIAKLRAENANYHAELCRERTELAAARVHECPKCGRACKECDCTEQRIAALESELENAQKQNAALEDALNNPFGGCRGKCGACIYCKFAALEDELVRLKNPGRLVRVGDTVEPYRMWYEERIAELDTDLAAAIADRLKSDHEWSRKLHAALADLVAARADDTQVSRLLAWLRDPERKEPGLAFTAGVLREAADEMMMLAQAEREACAVLCDEWKTAGSSGRVLMDVADAIRNPAKWLAAGEIKAWTGFRTSTATPKGDQP